MKYLVIDFIESFKPCISHYRAEHSPNRRYLPYNLSIGLLHKMFIEKKIEDTDTSTSTFRPVCSIKWFSTIFHSLNISFDSPQVDKCSVCESHVIQGDHECNESTCFQYIAHKERSRKAREEMKADEVRSSGNVKVVSVDMQKVLLLPKLSIKEAFFSRKLVLFNETFCDVSKNGEAVCVLWHEGDAGRKAKNITTTYIHYVFKFCRDFEEIILFADNCNAQNKNRLLLCALVRLVNDARIKAKTITIKWTH